MSGLSSIDRSKIYRKCVTKAELIKWALLKSIVPFCVIELR